MNHRPAMDTLEATRILEDEGFEPKAAEALVRLVDNAVQNSAASRSDLLELKIHIEKSERRVAIYTGVIIGIAGAILAITANFDEAVNIFSGM